MASNNQIIAMMKFIDMMSMLKVIDADIWLRAHERKWGHKTIGRPEWVKK